jgi:hypothetical protein
MNQYPQPPIVSSPPYPPPQQFTTADGTLLGAVDGVNKLFVCPVYLHRAEIYLNGIAQTLNFDCSFAGTGLIFKRAPQTGPPVDIVTIKGWVLG